MSKVGIQLTLLYLVLTAAAGVLMRTAMIIPIPWIEYDHILHAHSHLAILGWSYMAVFLLLISTFFDADANKHVKLTIVFWLTQFVLIGMFISFILQGYALFSIAFSTFQILLSYSFTVIVWKQLLRQSKIQGKTPMSHAFIKASLICLVLSSIGPWMLAILSANQLNGSDWYDVAIYYYLHFQYNGWLTLGLIGIVLGILEKKRVSYPVKLTRLHFKLYVWSLAPSFLLSVLWMSSHLSLYILATVGAWLQWIAVIVWIMILLRMRLVLTVHFRGWARNLFVLAFVALLLKSTMEIGASIPGLATLIYDSRNIVIGYLHLMLLGFVSLLCLSLFLQQGWLDDKTTMARNGYKLFLIGFIVNELILFVQGLLDWMQVDGLTYSTQTLWVASLMMAVGIMMFFVRKVTGIFIKSCLSK